MRHLMSGVRCSIFQFSATVIGVLLQAIVLGILSSTSLVQAAVVRVPRDFQSIQAAIDSTQSGDEVWVSGGTYAESITLRSGVGVYGGFSGNETSHDERDWMANPPILDGTSCIGGKQAQHVVTMDRVTSVTLDGFTVKGGYSREGVSSSFRAPGGGGIYTTGTLSAIVRNCLITENAFKPVIVVNGSEAYGRGCGIYAVNSGIDLIGCDVKRNIKPSNSGAVLLVNTTTTIANCRFTEHEGLALIVWDSSCKMVETTVAYNMQGAQFSTLRHDKYKIDGCQFVENGPMPAPSADYWYIGLLADAETVITNTAFIGNKGGAALCGSKHVTNCVFINNHGLINGGSVRNSIFCGNTRGFCDNPDTFRNCIIVNNDIETKILQNCLLQDNSALTYYYCNAINSVFINNYDTHVASKNSIFFRNASLDLSKISGSENLIADPLFAPPRMGHWTSPPIYDAASTQTILTDAITVFAPNKLTGQIIKVNSALTTSSCYVLSNTEHTVTVYGHAEDKATLGGEWLIMDYHVAAGNSPCVDRGMTIPDLTTDFEGRPRPLIGAYDIGIYEYPGVERPGGYVDLAAESAWFYKDKFYEGADITFGCNIRNWGDRNSTACLFSVSVDGVEKIRETLAPIAASGGVSTHQNLNIGQLTAGKHQITILADADKAVADSNRSNNTLVKEIDILEAANLQVVSAKVTPLQPKARDYVTVKATVRNASGVDVPKADVSLGSWWTQTIALGPNESKEVAFSLGEIEARKYQFTINATPQSPVVEKDYSDNSLMLKFGVGQLAAASGEWMLY